MSISFPRPAVRWIVALSMGALVSVGSVADADDKDTPTMPTTSPKTAKAEAIPPIAAEKVAPAKPAMDVLPIEKVATATFSLG